jgi:antitoxin PrlF
MVAKTSVRDVVLHASIRHKGVITLPNQVRQELGLEEGDEMLVSVQDGTIVLSPARVIPRDQEWFWTPEWQAGERQADYEYAQGYGRKRHSFDEFIADLTEGTTKS